MRLVKAIVPYLACIAVGIGVARIVLAIRGPGGGDLSSASSEPGPAAGATASRAPKCYRPISNVKELAITNPREPGYNPAALVKLGVNIQEIFAVEPRDREWAEALEKSVGERLLHDLPKWIPNISSLSFECRTFLCRLSYDFRTVDDLYAVEEALQAFRTAERTNQKPDLERRTTDLFLYMTDRHGERRPAESVAKSFTEMRRMALSQMRSGAMPVPPRLATGELPPE